jgi:8-oxo-dGTP pyrophosphatase MutT (NUDIX family)
MRRAAELEAALDGFEPLSQDEVRDVGRIRVVMAAGDPWNRSSRLHVTGSAVIVHPETRRVLLRWHERMRGWLHVGGHGEAGETDPLKVALREASEETCLGDLVPWPDGARPRLLHVAIVPVPPGRGEPEHQHADLRYALATSRPDDAIAETFAARLRWLPIPEAIAEVAEDNLRLTFERIDQLLRQPSAISRRRPGSGSAPRS